MGSARSPGAGLSCGGSSALDAGLALEAGDAGQALLEAGVLLGAAFDPERQGRWSFSSQQATLRRLDKAFAAFFRRVKSGEEPGYPHFRGVMWFDTV